MDKKSAGFLHWALIALFYTITAVNLGATQAFVHPLVAPVLPAVAAAPLVIKDATDAKVEAHIRDAVVNLNSAEQSLNAWGKVAMSEPVFVLNKGQFKITFDEGISNYVAAAQGNVSGEFRTALETSAYLGVAAQAQLTPPISLGKPPGTNSTSSNAPAYPTQAENVFSNFTPLLTLGASPSLDLRQAVEKGINDEVSQQLLAFMTSPDTATNPEQQVVFGIVQISCQPGERTKRHYLADFNVSVKYGRSGKDNLETSSSVKPGVISVLPLVDSRNIALQDSDRSQVELAAALSAALEAQGLTAEANAVGDYVRREESDSETKDSVPIVTSYTDGSTFGFQIYPSYETSSKANTQELQPITFPALVAILIDKRDYYDETNAVLIKAGAKGRSPWTYLVTQSETRWIRLKKPGFFNPDRSLYGRVMRAFYVDLASADLDWIESAMQNSPGLSGFGNTYEQLRISCDSLKTTALATSAATYLPDADKLFPDPPKASNFSITSVYPHELWRDTSTTFTINVKGVTATADILGVNIAGYAFKPVAATDCHSTASDGKTPDGMTINVKMPPSFSHTTDASNAVDFVVVTTKHAITTTVNMLLQGKVAPADGVATITRDANDKVLGIDIKEGNGLPESQLLDATKRILKKSEAPAKTTNLVH